MGCVIGKNSITCFRNHEIRFKIKLHDKQQNEWYCELDKARFENLPDETSIDIFNNTGKIHKRYIKKFLRIA